MPDKQTIIQWRRHKDDWPARSDGRVVEPSYAFMARRWAMAGLVAAGLHAGGVWLAMSWPQLSDAPDDQHAAIMIELAPIAVSLDVPQRNIAPGPQTMEADDRPDPESERPDEGKTEITQAEIEAKPLERAEVKAAQVALPPKAAPPDTKPVKKKRKAAPRNTAPPSSQAMPNIRAAAPAEGLASSTSTASWRGALMAHLNRHKRLPPGAAGPGVATITFTVDRSGRVLSVRLTRSAGDAALDAEAKSLPRRASPVPAPPPGAGSITVTVPIQFNR